MIENKKIDSIVSGSYIFITDDNEIKKETVGFILDKFKIDKNNFIEISNIKDSIKIDIIRKIKNKIFLKSTSRYNLLAIYNAQNMTREAANALLKILEEPPRFFVMMLFTDNIGKLIPTIISRCKKIIYRPSLEKKFNNRYIILLNKILSSEKIYEKFLLAHEITKGDKNDIDILEMLNQWMLYLKGDSSKKNINYIITIDKFTRLYNKSLNQKLYLENLFLEL